MPANFNNSCHSIFNGKMITIQQNHKLREHMGAIYAVDESTSITNADQKSSQVSSQESTSISKSTSNVSNIQTTTSDVKTDTDIDNSVKNTTVTDTDQSSKTDITSTTNTSNTDQSTKSSIADNRNIQDNLMKCGIDLEGAKNFNAKIDQSFRTNIDASNVIVVSGDGNSLSDVHLQSAVTNMGPKVDQSCVMNVVGDLASKQIAQSENSKSVSGGTGGSIGTEAGGNTATATTENTKRDQLDASTTTGTTSKQDNTTGQEQTQEQTTGQGIDQGTEQGMDASASAGGMMDNIVLVMCVAILVMMLLEDSGNSGSDIMKNLTNQLTSFVTDNSTLLMSTGILLLCKM